MVGSAPLSSVRSPSAVSSTLKGSSGDEGQPCFRVGGTSRASWRPRCGLEMILDAAGDGGPSLPFRIRGNGRHVADEDESRGPWNWRKTLGPLALFAPLETSGAGGVDDRQAGDRRPAFLEPGWADAMCR